MGGLFVFILQEQETTGKFKAGRQGSKHGQKEWETGVAYRSSGERTGLRVNPVDVAKSTEYTKLHSFAF